MRYIALLMLLFSMSGLHSQTYEVGVFAGGANTIGDVGRTNYILPSDIALGGVFKWNKSKRYAWRASLMYGQFTADDNKSSSTARQQRGYVVDNHILEGSVGLEFNFVDYNLHKLGPAFTPYLYTGVTYFRYDYEYFNGGVLQEINQKDGSFAVPITAGIKYRINQFLIFGAEIGARYTFTDNLDASNPQGSNYEEFQFGNIFSDDWYVFSGLTLTYTFGRKPCMDCFE
ncbi:hypothetical protein SAMN04488009_0901 [Maribacter sedimenticola]|uniref:DUF6089 domain-containing protein n=1 Tax=Maribacter sedimenticola TaxID=228956 RepID=A0ABY1SEC4_9FLAO|nr:DUF6089 family protein [Maribacter sedimenticola]SNR29225.1 hypothetical protein SAMN04488009_0901 [Maribacter sedimenticola]